MSRPPHAGQAGRGELLLHDNASVISSCVVNLFVLVAIGLFIGDPDVKFRMFSEIKLQRE